MLLPLFKVNAKLKFSALKIHYYSYTKPLPTIIKMTETGILIKEIYDPYFEAPLEIWESFATFLRRISYKKNEIIKELNKKENDLSIIIKGSAGIFLWKENSTICLDLCYENEFFGDYMSFLTQESTELFTQAIEPTEILSISFADLNELYKSSTIGE